MTKFSITTPIFYVNGPPHIGHAYTVAAADVLARARRLPTPLSPLRRPGCEGQAELRGTGRGDDPTSPDGLRGAGVFFLAGTDEHGTKIAEAASAAQEPPQQFVDKIAGAFRDAWKALDIQYDDFIRTTEPRHVRGVQHALRALHDRGFLYEKAYRGLYCTGCEKFLTERDLDAEGVCPLHNRKPDLLEEKNWFFRLEKFLPEVRRRIESDELRISPVERKNEVLGILTQGIEDFSVSRPKERVSWAIPLPFDNSQTCYVWVDALLNYVTALGYGSPDTQHPTPSALEQYWPADLQLIGQDILKFHAVYWPALLLALDLPLPKEIFVHGFFTVNGQKISKSLGNAIDPLELVQRYGSDATRYLLLSQFPFGASGDVNVDRFDEQYDAILANTIGNLVFRTVTLLQKFSGGKIPDAPPDTSVVGEGLRALPSVFAGGAKQSLSSPRTREPAAHSSVILNAVKDLSSAVSASPNTQHPTPDTRHSTPDSLVQSPIHLAQALNQYADRTAPWKESDPAKRAAALRTLADGIVSLALLAEPLLPKTSAAIQHAFGVTNRQLPAPGTEIKTTDPQILFPRLSS